jgi:hypothetical protein
MATENIVMLACAAALVTLHVLGGSLAVLRPRTRRRQRESIPTSEPPPATMSGVETRTRA